MGPGPLPQPDPQAPLARLGVVVALPQEARPLRRVLGAHGRPAGGGAGLVLAVSGVGAQRAHEAAHRLLDAGARALMSWGSAAGLRPGLAAGTVLLPETVIDAQRHRFATDPAWHQAMVTQLAARAHRLSTGPLAEAAGLLKSAADKEALLRRTGAVAADMESAAIAEVARGANVPFMVIRAVADPAHGVIPACVSQAMDERGRVHTAKLLGHALISPAQWVQLVRLAWWFGAAERALSRAAPHMTEVPPG